MAVLFVHASIPCDHFFSECRLFQQISTSWVMLLLSGFRNMPFNYISAVDACLWSIMPSYVALVFYSSNWINYVCPKSLYGWTMWCELNIDIYGYTCDEMVWFFFVAERRIRAPAAKAGAGAPSRPCEQPPPAEIATGQPHFEPAWVAGVLGSLKRSDRIHLFTIWSNLFSAEGVLNVCSISRVNSSAWHVFS
jgi:hypothetical protein